MEDEKVEIMRAVLLFIACAGVARLCKHEVKTLDVEFWVQPYKLYRHFPVQSRKRGVVHL